MPVIPETPEEKRAREERAAYRRAHPEEWPIRVYRLGEEPDDDLSDTTAAAERDVAGPRPGGDRPES